MQKQNRIDLARYRMELARECVSDAQDNLSRGKLRDASNRSYYAIFDAMRALLNLDGREFKRHSGVIAEFRRLYIRTGVFPPEFSDMIGDAFDARNNSDYQDFYVITREETERQTENAAVFVDAVENYLNTLLGQMEP